MTKNQGTGGPEDATPTGDASPGDLADEQIEEVGGGTLLIAMSLDVCPGSPAQGWSSH